MITINKYLDDILFDFKEYVYLSHQLDPHRREPHIVRGGFSISRTPLIHCFQPPPLS